jgi:hypothetical protein
MLKTLKLDSDGDDSGRKKCKRGYGSAYGGIWRSLRLAGNWSLESGGQFYCAAFPKNLPSLAVKVFSCLIYFSNNVINVVFSMRFATVLFMLMG